MVMLALIQGHEYERKEGHSMPCRQTIFHPRLILVLFCFLLGGCTTAGELFVFEYQVMESRIGDPNSSHPGEVVWPVKVLRGSSNRCVPITLNFTELVSIIQNRSREFCEGFVFAVDFQINDRRRTRNFDFRDLGVNNNGVQEYEMLLDVAQSKPAETLVDPPQRVAGRFGAVLLTTVNLQQETTAAGNDPQLKLGNDGDWEPDTVFHLRLNRISQNTDDPTRGRGEGEFRMLVRREGAQDRDSLAIVYGGIFNLKAKFLE